MKTHNSRLHLGGNISVFVFVITAIQPFLDVISYFCADTQAENIPLILRGILLAVITATGFRVSEKKVYYIMALILLLHSTLHLFLAGTVTALAPSELISDAANLIRIYSLPITTIAFVSFLKKEPLSRSAIEKGCLFALYTIAFIEIAAVVTQTDPHSYPNKELGVLGWFYFANSQSAILSMLYPIALLSAVNGRHRKIFVFTLIAGGATLFFLATRLAYFALVFTLLLLTVTCLYLWKRKGAPLQKEAFALTLILPLVVSASFFSPMAKNLDLVSQNAALKQEHIDSLAAEGGTQAVYDYYLPTLVGRFGYERTYSLYDSSTNADDICDVRRMKIAYCRLLTEDYPLSAIAGHPIEELTYDGKNHDVENDLHGIFFLTGATGLCLLFFFFLYCIIPILRRALQDRDRFISLRNVAYLSSFLFGAMHAYFTAGVLRRPNASFFLALTLALMYSAAKINPKGNVYDDR